MNVGQFTEGRPLCADYSNIHGNLRWVNLPCVAGGWGVRADCDQVHNREKIKLRQDQSADNSEFATRLQYVPQQVSWNELAIFLQSHWNTPKPKTVKAYLMLFHQPGAPEILSLPLRLPQILTQWVRLLLVRLHHVSIYVRLHSLAHSLNPQAHLSACRNCLHHR